MANLLYTKNISRLFAEWNKKLSNYESFNLLISIIYESLEFFN